ncbi:TetR/AcrR family transcriptional regulator [Peribacillus castrilensis]|uniref:TetR/AcrR family transcriptional regulator n=1 Tax=Peribacillus simplex TaxID=1478 RepID=A0AAN2PH48_9BACI|nr:MULTISPECIES: TetR/AcrR family transcriptional regulator [Bacillaceae]MCF7622276.1 TetR/AcrR family transcriptional regulator [Peribacillus frigoritolerans]MEA3574817.1 TetR/AcrR family transcriptional regulator [Peribacillus frigoritolerans]NCT38540.1 TetR/AcrR family transcriptional regulator [Peribacillus frigoritolerans]PRA78358.1 TetR/AcrR family transcriptional regulator [Peribacillus simplex]CEG32271.1 TetR/AcrR family transcriptional regulator [Peribacillus simplex]
MIEPRKKQLRGEKTREKILQISLKLFSEKGYDKVTVDEIVKKSGSSKGSFYQHFSAKSDIFLVRFIEVDDYYREVFRSFPVDMDATEKLFIFIRKLMRFLEVEMGKDLMKVIYSSALDSKEHTYFLNSNRSLFKIIRSLIEEAKEQNDIGTDQSVNEISQLIIQSLMGIIYHWGLNNSEQSLESLSIPLTKTIINGLKTKN